MVFQWLQYLATDHVAERSSLPFAILCALPKDKERNDLIFNVLDSIVIDDLKDPFVSEIIIRSMDRMLLQHDMEFFLGSLYALSFFPYLLN
jgi:hypothetical protein